MVVLEEQITDSNRQPCAIELMIQTTKYSRQYPRTIKRP